MWCGIEADGLCASWTKGFCALRPKDDDDGRLNRGVDLIERGGFGTQGKGRIRTHDLCYLSC